MPFLGGCDALKSTRRGLAMQKAVRHWISSRAERLFALARHIGLEASDSDETALRKRVAVALFAGTLPFTIAWSAIYLAAGAPLAAAVPGFYSVFTPINTLIFARTRNLAVVDELRRTVRWIAGFVALLGYADVYAQVTGAIQLLTARRSVVRQASHPMRHVGDPLERTPTQRHRRGRLFQKLAALK
jgi:hypothetical protein